MEHLLDNPIWNALRSGNKDFSLGNERCKFFIREIAAFAGLKDNAEEDLDSLHQLTQKGAKAVLFTPQAINIPGGWQILGQKPLLQMVYTGEALPGADDDDLIPLAGKDVPAMLDLTARTNPGPFLTRTIDFGNYKGIFDGKKLVAMTGQRLHPEPYIEVSAVCTDPAYTGRGYARRLILDQIRTIVGKGETPFLHVLPDNTNAFNLYKKIGFETRKEMMYYVLENV